MSERDDEDARGDAGAGDLAAVEARISELRQRKRTTVRWHMSRQTAERAIAAIKEGAWRPAPGRGKSRRRKRHKRLL
ncbi:MAG: hypothetical protein ABR499_12380 [Gemmatimonadaceae bacterium]